jgi:hypothetical protein
MSEEETHFSFPFRVNISFSGETFFFYHYIRIHLFIVAFFCVRARPFMSPFFLLRDFPFDRSRDEQGKILHLTLPLCWDLKELDSGPVCSIHVHWRNFKHQQFIFYTKRRPKLTSLLTSTNEPWRTKNSLWWRNKNVLHTIGYLHLIGVWDFARQTSREIPSIVRFFTSLSLSFFFPSRITKERNTRIVYFLKREQKKSFSAFSSRSATFMQIIKISRHSFMLLLIFCFFCSVNTYDTARALSWVLWNVSDRK